MREHNASRAFPINVSRDGLAVPRRKRHVLLPRRAIVQAIIERGQARGEIRVDIAPEAALDLMPGSFLARVFAGLDTGPRWRKAAFATWWEILRERHLT